MISAGGAASEGTAEGRGTKTFADGSRYVGQFYKGQRWGLGRQTYLRNLDASDLPRSLFLYAPHRGGLSTSGSGKNPVRDGEVAARIQKLQSLNSEYVGEYARDMRNGDGNFTSPVESYEGQWVDDRPQGVGIWKNLLSNAEYEGEWIAGACHGEGRETTAEGHVYEGPFCEGMREGSHGVLTYRNGDVYEGSFLRDLKHGPHAVMRYRNGDSYEGDFCDDVRNGVGRYRWAVDGTVYDGEFRQNKRHGRGTCTFASTGDRYEGQWISDTISGLGAYFYANGDVYEGSFRENKRDGLGVCRYADGSVYRGPWLADERHGNGGQWISADGSEEYMGDWSHNQRSGRGRMRYLHHSLVLQEQPAAAAEGPVSGTDRHAADDDLDDGYSCRIEYDGEWKNDAMHGTDGTLRYTDGRVYKGTMVANVRHWTGVCKYPSGASYRGSYNSGIRHGPGVYTSSTGDRLEGSWDRGHSVGPARLFISSRQILVDVDFSPGSLVKCALPDGSIYEGPWSGVAPHSMQSNQPGLLKYPPRVVWPISSYSSAQSHISSNSSIDAAPSSAIIVLSDGRYEGSFEQGRRHGPHGKLSFHLLISTVSSQPSGSGATTTPAATAIQQLNTLWNILPIPIDSSPSSSSSSSSLYYLIDPEVDWMVTYEGPFDGDWMASSSRLDHDAAATAADDNRTYGNNSSSSKCVLTFSSAEFTVEYSDVVLSSSSSTSPTGAMSMEFATVRKYRQHRGQEPLLLFEYCGGFVRQLPHGVGTRKEEVHGEDVDRNIFGSVRNEAPQGRQAVPAAAAAVASVAHSPSTTILRAKTVTGTFAEGFAHGPRMKCVLEDLANGTIETIEGPMRKDVIEGSSVHAVVVRRRSEMDGAKVLGSANANANASDGDGDGDGAGEAGEVLSEYVGTYARNERSGMGILTTPTSRYEGEFLDGEPCGQGVALYQQVPALMAAMSPPAGAASDGSTIVEYRGRWLHGKWHHEGVLSLYGGRVVVSAVFQKGNTDSRGTIQFRDFPPYLRYEGDLKTSSVSFLKIEMHGRRGTLTSVNGDVYSGSFLHDQKSGLGTLTFAGGTSVYKGEFLEDEPHGHGELVVASGRHYVGTFIKGTRHGHGVLRDPRDHHMVYEGPFVADERHGDGAVCRTDEYEYEGRYEHDQKSGRSAGRLKTAKYMYEGDFEHDLPHGPHGVFVFHAAGFAGAVHDVSAGHRWRMYRYEGEVAEGEMHGRGKLLYRSDVTPSGGSGSGSGSRSRREKEEEEEEGKKKKKTEHIADSGDVAVYEGRFEHGKREDRNGKFVCQEFTYVGPFVADHRTGAHAVVQVQKDQSVYEGPVVDGRKEGEHGVWRTERWKYSGPFAEDMRHSTGALRGLLEVLDPSTGREIATVDSLWQHDLPAGVGAVVVIQGDLSWRKSFHSLCGLAVSSVDADGRSSSSSSSSSGGAGAGAGAGAGGAGGGGEKTSARLRWDDTKTSSRHSLSAWYTPQMAFEDGSVYEGYLTPNSVLFEGMGTLQVAFPGRRGSGSSSQRVVEPIRRLSSATRSRLPASAPANGKDPRNGSDTWCVRYTGNFSKGVASGQGTSQFADGRLHRGLYVNGLFEGQGTMHFYERDAVAAGAFDDSASAVQHQQWSSVYSGEFTRGLRHGKGVWMLADSSQFSGQWALDCPVEGTLTLNNNTERYVGQFNREGHLHGMGRYEYSNGDVYIGPFVGGVRQGGGARFVSGDGSVVYEGAYVDDKMHGQHCVVRSAADGIYEGEFKGGLKCGSGRQRYPNGDVFEGEWHRGKRRRGKMIHANGEIYEGEFS